jgi:hypothetical protein
VRYDVLLEVKIKIKFMWEVTSRIAEKYSSILKTEAAGPSETLVPFS